MKVLACITARMTSARLPGKVMADVGGRPNLARVVSRYECMKKVDHVVVATSDDPSDDRIADWCELSRKEYFRGSLDDVCKRIFNVAELYHPDYIVRGLADAPFIEPQLMDLAIEVVSAHGVDAGRICAGNTQPVYGAAEFPYSYWAVRELYHCSSGSQREHFGAYLDENREEFQVIYPLPSREYKEMYFRPYRLELDTEADLALIREVYRRLGPDQEPTLHEVIKLLDSDPDLAAMNAHISERTGPLTSFSPETRRDWASLAIEHTVDWEGDWSWLRGNCGQDKAIWCDSGQCYLGYAKRVKENGHNRNILVRPEGEIIRGDALLACPCGAGRKWYGG